MNYEENFLSFQKVKTGIDEAYLRLLNSNNLAQDLLSSNENYECFLVNQNINHKLTTYLSTIDKSKLTYSVEHAKKLVSDSQYCEKWLEIIKSYLFTVGIDIEKENKNDVFSNDAVEKSSEKLKTVLSSLKLVAQISIETRNLELFDRIFDIYCLAYESYVRKPSKLLQQCFFALENSIIETPLFTNYSKFCKDRFIKGIFVDLEEQINQEANIDETIFKNKSIKEELHKQEEIQDFSVKFKPSYLELLNQGIDNQIKALQNNTRLNLETLVSIEENCIIANNYNQELLNQLLTAQYKQKFLNLINLYFLKVGINIQNNVGLPIASFVNKDELKIIISSLKIIATEASNTDEKFFLELKQTYSQLYQKFSQVGLLDNETGLAECFYANEIGNKTEISLRYLEENSNGIFFELESEIDKKRFDQLILANIKKFDEKTLKFYNDPYVDIRLEKSANQEDYQVQIVYDGNQINAEQVAQEFGQDPFSIKDWQYKNLEEGDALSFSHETTAHYLGIAKGPELNQTLLAIRDQARLEQEMFNENAIKNNVDNNAKISNSNDKSIDDEDLFNIEEFENYEDDFVARQDDSESNQAVNGQISNSVNLTVPQNVADKFIQKNNELDFKDQQDGVFDIYQFYVENRTKIESILQNPALLRILNLASQNPDLKIETTSNPLSESVRHQLKLVFLKGFNQKSQLILASALAEGECKPWQLSHVDEAKERGFDGSFIVPHDYSAKILGIRNPNDVNKGIEEVFDLTSKLDLFNTVLIEYLRSDISFNILRTLIEKDFSIAFDYSESDNIFSKKNLVLIAENENEREYIYNFLGYSLEQNQNISSEELLDHRAQITDQNGDIILSDEICKSLFGVSNDSEIDLTIRKIEAILHANKQLCDIFNANEHDNLCEILELDLNQSHQDNEDFSDEENELNELYA
jgi:hypothetical protein